MRKSSQQILCVIWMDESVVVSSARLMKEWPSCALPVDPWRNHNLSSAFDLLSVCCWQQSGWSLPCDRICSVCQLFQRLFCHLSCNKVVMNISEHEWEAEKGILGSMQLIIKILESSSSEVSKEKYNKSKQTKKNSTWSWKAQRETALHARLSISSHLITKTAFSLRWQTKSPKEFFAHSEGDSRLLCWCLARLSSVPHWALPQFYTSLLVYDTSKGLTWQGENQQDVYLNRD